MQPFKTKTNEITRQFRIKVIKTTKAEIYYNESIISKCHNCKHTKP